MSTSEDKERVRLDVRSEDTATEIVVTDGQFQLAALGAGHVRASLAPGIYKIQVSAGFAMREEYAILRPGMTAVEKVIPAVEFLSPVPLAYTTKTDDALIRAAETQSERRHAGAGDGSWIYVFVRRRPQHAPASVSTDIGVHPATGLTLCSAAGEPLVDLTNCSTWDLDGDAWAACNVEVKPGIYRLRVELPRAGTCEQSLVATPGWQTQVFILQRDYGAGDWRADPAGGAVLLARGPGFDSRAPSMRLAELARLGLAHEQRVLSDDMRQMLRDNVDNPMLGIYGAHLLLRDEQVDPDLLTTLISKLRRLLGEHPDVEALALALDPGASSYRFDLPPMLRRSWDLVLNATPRNRQLVPRGSLSEDIATHLLNTQPWLVWVTLPDSADALRTIQLNIEAALRFNLQLPRPSMEPAPPEEVRINARVGLEVPRPLANFVSAAISHLRGQGGNPSTRAHPSADALALPLPEEHDTPPARVAPSALRSPRLGEPSVVPLPPSTEPFAAYSDIPPQPTPAAGAPSPLAVDEATLQRLVREMRLPADTLEDFVSRLV